MKRYLKLVGVVVAAAGIFLVGVGVGNHNTAIRLDKYFYTLVLSGSATELKVRIKLMELLKHDDYIQALEILENLVDADLAQLALYVNNPPPTPDKDIIEAIVISKKYREKYPGHRVNRTFENSVKKTLDYVSDR